MINFASNELMPVYLKLFDTVPRSGIMPQTWYNGIIKPFLKVVLKWSSNYRGIGISSCLLDHVRSLDILHKSQIGFLANNHTEEDVLTLRTKYFHGD